MHFKVPGKAEVMAGHKGILKNVWLVLMLWGSLNFSSLHAQGVSDSIMPCKEESRLVFQNRITANSFLVNTYNTTNLPIVLAHPILN